MAKKAFVTRTFTIDEIDEWDLPWGTNHMVQSDEITDHNRWSIWHELIFEAPDDKKLWKLEYQVPATEMQDCDRWPDLVGIQVEAQEVTTIKYVEVVATDGDPL